MKLRVEVNLLIDPRPMKLNKEARRTPTRWEVIGVPGAPRSSVFLFAVRGEMVSRDQIAHGMAEIGTFATLLSWVL